VLQDCVGLPSVSLTRAQAVQGQVDTMMGRRHQSQMLLLLLLPSDSFGCCACCLFITDTAANGSSAISRVPGGMSTAATT
jgi:hypothetical protein